MDMEYFDSSEDREEIDNYQSSGGCKTGTETLSADHERSETKKSKIIKKNYEPIKDGNIYIRYEDDPVEYKRLRKKIQNRESAARVRGRKKGTMESLEVEVEQLKKVNSELMLKNATLETENRTLKSEVQFLRGIVKPNSKTSQSNTSSDSIDRYLNLQLTKKDSFMKSENNYQSPFEQEDSALSWVRSSYSSGSRSNWSTIFVLTIVVCVFVLPSSDSADSVVIAQQTGTSQIVTQTSILNEILSYGKILVKCLVLIGYLLFAGSFVYGKYCKRKLKKF